MLWHACLFHTTDLFSCYQTNRSDIDSGEKCSPWKVLKWGNWFPQITGQHILPVTEETGDENATDTSGGIQQTKHVLVHSSWVAAHEV